MDRGTIDLLTDENCDEFGLIYVFILSPKVPKHNAVIVHFPHHPEPEHRQLNSRDFKTSNAFNEELISRLRISKSFHITTQSKQKFRFAAVKANVYIVWVEVMNKQARAYF